MPRQKDFKRLVRSRMEKTGESYTAARLRLIRKKEPAPDLAAAAGLSEGAVVKQTGRTWAEWVALLDAAHCAEKPHREIVKCVSSLGIPSWWSQMVTVGYERIRGLRAKGQRREGSYDTTRSRTFAVPVKTLYSAFASARKRAQWLPARFTVQSATPHKSMRLVWEDGSRVQIGFTAKGAAKSSVAVQHEKLPDRESAMAMKSWWAERLEVLAKLLT